ncbi:hypothetical protein [Aeromonas media]|uniref:hypothetical protein n=2 Tax=Aeromonas TaxID=642 RepID=UPI0018CF0D63|nr:hypothetical protein [Aeromonas media]
MKFSTRSRMPRCSPFAGEKKTEYHVDGGDNRKDHGNLLADGEVLVKHVDWRSSTADKQVHCGDHIRVNGDPRLLTGK